MKDMIQITLSLSRAIFHILCFIADSVYSTSLSYTPLRPPAVPLATRSPYTSVWSSGPLNDVMPKFWAGNEISWVGMVTVDGISYGYLGNGFDALPETPNYQPAIPLTAAFDSHYSNYTFQADGITISVSFFSPVLPQDYCRTSIPLSYLTTSVQANDNHTHNVQFYSDIGATWLDHGDNPDPVRWEFRRNGENFSGTLNESLPQEGIYSWIYQPRIQRKFHEWRDIPQWGSMAYTTSPMKAQDFRSASGSDLKFRYSYIRNRTFDENASFLTRGLGGKDAVFAYIHGFQNVRSAEVRYTIGSIQDPVIMYLDRGGANELVPWWKQCYHTRAEMIRFHWQDYNVAQALAFGFHQQLRADISSLYRETSDRIPRRLSRPSLKSPIVMPRRKKVSTAIRRDISGISMSGLSEADAYNAIVSLSARQVMASSVLAVRPSNDSLGRTGKSEPFLFMKEISSDGMSTTSNQPKSGCILRKEERKCQHGRRPVPYFAILLVHEPTSLAACP
jgi:hypothetical protein